ncbi:helix-turn-helix transcriptional regulator [Magnetospirillum sp. 64-120]|uniref:helix-turn-helix transcriptional regulator n=1 Tax=Magnetospirillum sp. 64-120 TaxID=1895778 RepID=UPI00092B4093|nr:helix-turn-helix transcriptional regulator [Magnetospirillum sp. 64-120]OJX70254.1 MAG: DNA-binding protein [Magnetospirillum sp. 64-120]
MLTHGEIWAAIDALARENGMTASALARRAGLDPTTFNKSKRVTREGKLRWPSTESVAKVLEATGASLAQLLGHIEPALRPVATVKTGATTIPLIGSAQAGDSGYFDDAGYPCGGSWDEIPFPGTGDPHAYALEVSGDSMEPLYRDGDTVIVSPAASVRRGDRVVVKTVEGEVMVKQLLRQTAKRIDLASLNPDHPGRSFTTEEVAWIARILWASQ